jgi:hypothetical protein
MDKENEKVSRSVWLESFGLYKEWMDKDNYKQTRTMSKFLPNEAGRWQHLRLIWMR